MTSTITPTILTASGLSFNLLAPNPDLIEIEDIAHALSHLCRFTGHTRVFYSVAEHSVRVSNIVPPQHALEALLHDAAEAYIGDVSSPLKAQLHEYRNIEFALEQAIRQRFGLPPKATPCIKQADLTLLATEKRDLMPAHQDDWALLQGITPLPERIAAPLPAHIARWYFLDHFETLTNRATA
jgi:hypothetical protein